MTTVAQRTEGKELEVVICEVFILHIKGTSFEGKLQ